MLNLGWRGILIADQVDGAAAVDIHKADIDVVLQQLGASGHGVCVAAADLHSHSMSA